MGFYDEKENLLNAEKAMNIVTVRFNEQLNQFDRQTLEITNAIYQFRKFKTNYYLNSKNPNEKGFKEKCSEEIKARFKINCSPENVDSFIAMINEKAKPVLEFIENYKKELQKTYMEYCLVLRCAIDKEGLDYINATQNRENQFKNELINGIFASSGFSDLENYIGRAASEGYGMNVNNSVVVYPDNPFKSIEEQQDVDNLLLRKDVYVYSMDASEFEPVVDFELGRDGTYGLRFGHEWISRNESLKCEQEAVNRVPREMLERKQVFYKKQGISSEELSIHSRGEFFDKYSKLIASSRLGYINGEFNIHSIPELFEKGFEPRKLEDRNNVQQIIENKSKSVLYSAEEAINENTRTGKVNEQAQTMKARQQERMNPNIEKEDNDLGLDDE